MVRSVNVARERLPQRAIILISFMDNELSLRPTRACDPLFANRLQIPILLRVQSFFRWRLILRIGYLIPLLQLDLQRASKSQTCRVLDKITSSKRCRYGRLFLFTTYHNKPVESLHSRSQASSSLSMQIPLLTFFQSLASFFPCSCVRYRGATDRYQGTPGLRLAKGTTQDLNALIISTACPRNTHSSSFLPRSNYTNSSNYRELLLT